MLSVKHISKGVGGMAGRGVGRGRRGRGERDLCPWPPHKCEWEWMDIGGLCG